ncbi:MAG: hypothetical protein QM809_07955 [Gordonia sp. (in: high G+C Gram-positive bacteria)]|uniref:hypothetical protein n=1 Tax=Gordonia sp. (in: high G+C Gram-positive bacteria) TaxID=84139 RepID=UPI0039E2C4E3
MTGGTNEPIDVEFTVDDGGWTPPPAPSPAEATGYTEDGRPTLDHVRDKIEKRTATALGSEELAGLIPEAVAARDAFDERQEAAKSRLEEIRRSMRNDS